jgi:hypothetical protein
MFEKHIEMEKKKKNNRQTNNECPVAFAAILGDCQCAAQRVATQRTDELLRRDWLFSVSVHSISKGQ